MPQDAPQYLEALTATYIIQASARLGDQAEVLVNCGYDFDELTVLLWPRGSPGPRMEVVPRSMAGTGIERPPRRQP